MTWLAVAEKDFQDAIRSKVLWVLSFLFILFAGGVAFLFSQIPGLQQAGSEVSTLGLINFLSAPVGFLIPIIGLLLGYKALAGEVEMGSVKLLLSLPHSRSNVVLGKFVGRTLVLAVSVVVGFAVATVVILAYYPDISPVNYVLFILLTVVFGSAYVSIGTGISALTKSSSKAGAGIFGVFVLFNFLWSWIGFGINFLLNGSLFFGAIQRPPDWYLLFNRLSPGGAFNGTMSALLDPSNPIGNLTAQSGDPFYLSAWFAFLILLGWVLLPIGLGNLRFQHMDL